MWAAKNMDSEDLENRAVVIEAVVTAEVAWYERLRELVDGGRALKMEEHEGSVRRWRYVEIRRWESGAYAVVVRKGNDPLTPPILVCDNWDAAYEEFWEQADALWPGVR